MNISIHKTILFQILKDIYSDTTISPFLGFKGGTAALMFYGLNRFSVDLDFDLLDEKQEDYVFTRIAEIIKKYGNLKVKINRRQYGSRFEIKSYLGVSMLVMTKEDMFAHKLMAMFERIGKTSRDIYDVWFFLQNRFPINREIVEKRANMPFGEFVPKCILKLEKFNNRNILNGVGELLAPNQKDWAKTKLLAETIALLKLLTA